MTTLDCGHPPRTMPTGSCATGSAMTTEGQSICYDCAERREFEAFQSAAHYCAYVSTDGSKIQTWTGFELAKITASRPMRLSRRSNWHGSTIQSIYARAADGSTWYGRGSPGVCISLRRRRAGT